MPAKPTGRQADDVRDEEEPRILPLSAAGRASLPALLHPLIREAAQAARERSLAPVRITCDVPAGLSLDADPVGLSRVLRGLVDTALAAAAAAPRVREVIVTAVDMTDWIEIEVADSGAAAADAAALAAARSAANAWGGTVLAAPCPEGGMAVTLRLPRRRRHVLAA